jgi:peptide/nickel transport system substrate-binding protein
MEGAIMDVKCISVALCAIVMSTAVSAQSAGKITVAENEGASANWALETDDAFILTRAGCLEALARIDFDGQLQPSLAVSWKQTSPTSWEFTLRDGVKFQDGQPLNAEAVTKALNALLKAPTPARSFPPKLIKLIETVGPNVVRVTTPDPSVLVPYRMAAPNTGILSPAAYGDGKVNPVGTCTGPFVITQSVPQQSITLKRNDAYWGGKVALANAEIRTIPDANSRATQIRTGEAQVSRLVPVSALSRLKSTPDVKVVGIDTPRTTELLLNNKKAPLNDVRVRRAIQSAIDVTAITAAIYEGAAEPAVGPFSPGEPWAPKQAKPAAYDVNRAKGLLAEAGIKPGTLRLGLLAYVEKTQLKDLAAVVQEQLKVLGIQVDIRVGNYSAIEPDLLSGNYDMALLSRSHLTDVADPAGFLQADYACGGSYNISQYCDAEVDAQLKHAASLTEPAERHTIYGRIAQKLQDEAVNVFIIHEHVDDAVSAKVRNYRLHPLGHYLLTPTLSLN